MGRGKSKQSVGQKKLTSIGFYPMLLLPDAVEDGNGNWNLESMFLCRASSPVSTGRALRYCYCY